MSDTAIRVEQLGKFYKIGAQKAKYKTFRDTLAHAAATPARMARSLFSRNGQAKTDDNTFWALKDISFEVKRGEVVGIIGRNGAGKSTLLKILSRITDPTTGFAEIHGRVGSLLEVGTGFHPELTGRENIYLNGAILGMSKADIERRFDEMVAFAEVEKFIDTPVKHYSSGMYLRLAFAVAAHLEPEILLVDEVLAVGDAQFQKKCLGKMGEVAKEGRTVLFVSHNMAAIDNLCSDVIVLCTGELAFKGKTSTGIEQYLSGLATAENSQVDLSLRNRPSWALPWIVDARVLNTEGKQQSNFGLGSDVTIELDFRTPNGEKLRRPVMGLVVNHSVRGTVGAINSLMTGFEPNKSEYSMGRIRCKISGTPFLQGLYTVDLWLGDGPRDVDTVTGALSFSIEATDIYGTGRSPFATLGIALIRASWEIEATRPVLVAHKD